MDTYFINLEEIQDKLVISDRSKYITETALSIDTVIGEYTVTVDDASIFTAGETIDIESMTSSIESILGNVITITDEIDAIYSTGGLVGLVENGAIELNDVLGLEAGMPILIDGNSYLISSILADTVSLNSQLVASVIIDTVVSLDTPSLDGLTIPTAFRTIDNTATQNNGDIRFWVKRGDYTFDYAITFHRGTDNKYISWPNTEDPFYNERPQLGIDAGWDNSVEEKTIISFTQNGTAINMSTTITSVYNFSFIDKSLNVFPEYDISGFFSFTINSKIEFENCNFNIYRLLYTTSYGYGIDLNFEGIVFNKCEIISKETLIYGRFTSGYGSGDVHYPIFSDCTFMVPRLFDVYQYDSDTRYYVYLSKCTIKPHTPGISIPIFIRTTRRNSNATGINSHGGTEGLIDVSLENIHIDTFMESPRISNLTVDISSDSENYIGNIFYIYGGTDNHVYNTNMKIRGVNANNLFNGTGPKTYKCNFDIADSVFTEKLLYETNINRYNFIKLNNVTFGYTAIADVSSIRNCRKYGSHDYWIVAYNESVNLINCDTSGGSAKGGLLYAIHPAKINAYNTKTGEGNIVHSSSTGSVDVISTEPAKWSIYRGSVVFSPDQVRRNLSTAANSIKISSFRDNIDKWSSYSDSLNSGLEVDVPDNTIGIELYGAYAKIVVGGTEIPSEDSFRVMGLSDLPSNEFIFAEADDSAWDIQNEPSLIPFKVVIPVHVDFGRKVNVLFDINSLKMDGSIYIDPVMTVITG